mgnify:CR=1 FL=1
MSEDSGKGDVWSLGVTLLHIALLEKPLNVNGKMCKKRIERYLLRRGGYPDFIRFMIHWMLQYNEEDRYSFEQLSQILDMVQYPLAKALIPIEAIDKPEHDLEVADTKPIIAPA